jgi:hypothetical protein
MARHAIPDSVDFVGEWFLPIEGENSKQIPGTLSWSSGRALLQLNDAFIPLRGPFFGDEEHHYQAIHGTTTNNNIVSVLRALRTGTHINFGQAGFRESERLISSWVIVGAHVAPQTRYSEIRFRIPGLQIWLGRSGVRQTILPKTENSPAGVIYQIDGLAEETTSIPCLNMAIGWGIDRNFSGDLITDITVKTSACLRIKPHEPQNIDWFLTQLSKASTLLAFISGTPMAPDHVSAIVADTGQEVEILVALREAKCCTFSREWDFFMLRPDMVSDMADIFIRWFEIYDSIAMPSQLALSVLSSEKLWLHVEFLSLMQALEGFHRATTPGLYVTEEQYEPIHQALSNAIPKFVRKDHREALKSRIRYGNEVSLRKRLDALVSRLELPLRKRILGGNGSMPRSWVVTRNYYTHWDEASRASTLDGPDMHRAAARMKTLLRALYLDLAGVPQSAIENSLKNACKESQYLIQLNSAEMRKKNPESEYGVMMRVDVKDAESPQ